MQNAIYTARKRGTAFKVCFRIGGSKCNGGGVFGCLGPSKCNGGGGMDGGGSMRGAVFGACLGPSKCNGDGSMRNGVAVFGRKGSTRFCNGCVFTAVGFITTTGNGRGGVVGTIMRFPYSA